MDCTTRQTEKTVESIASRTDLTVGDVAPTLRDLERVAYAMRETDGNSGEIWTLLGAGSDALHAES